LTERTAASTYSWLKGNKELINVATSRAKEQLVIVSSLDQVKRLHAATDDDDLYELVRYVQANGESVVTPKAVASRALGVKPYSTETETAFLENINHAIDNIMPERIKYAVQKEVAISHVFDTNISGLDLFYTGRFDFVVYEKLGRGFPVLAIELDGKEHHDRALVIERDRKKTEICRQHGFEFIRIDNSYARRYQYIKNILIHFFETQ
jgi:hypothetical protein